MTDLKEMATKTPTVYELAFEQYIEGSPNRCVDNLLTMVRALHQELADEREIVRSQGGRIADLGLRLSSMQGRFAALASAIPPIDESVAHTVEVGTQQPDEAAIEKALLTAFHLGQREANLRNAPQPAMTDEGDPS